MPHSYNYFKQDVKDYILTNIPIQSKILDIGAGCGTYSDLLRGYGYEIDAVEVWEPYIHEFNLKDKYNHIYNQDVFNLPQNELLSYDFYILGDCLEHFSVKDAQFILSLLKSNGKKYLIAIPYEMFQDEYEGNKYEIHLQPDLTPEVMSQRYPDLGLIYGNEFYGYYINKIEKHDKAYVLYADESYFDLAQLCRDSIIKHSKYPVYIYTLDFNPKYDYDYCIYWECDIKPLKKRKEFIDREDANIYKILIERPKIVKHALGKLADQIAYVDTDSIATELVDSIFDHFDNDSTYPYFTEGIYEYLIVNGRGGAESRDDLSGTLEAPACELFGINQYNRQKYRQTGYFVVGQNCIGWLNEWAWMCQHPAIMGNNGFYAPFNEETIANCLLWKYSQQKGLPYCYINGLHDKLEYKDFEYFLKEWQKVPLEQNHLFYHGEKDINKLKNFNL